MRDIVGEVTQNKVRYLNNRLKNKIIEKGKMNKPTVYIQYSDMEHTYEDHIKYLLSDLYNADIDVHEEVLHYPNHGDLYKYFPKYLVETVNRLIYG